MFGRLLASSLSEQLKQGLLLGAALVGGLLVLGVILLWVRRKCQRMSAARSENAGFSMEGLEALYRSGQISQGEFRRLRRLALGLPALAGEEEKSSSSSTPEDDDGNSTPGADQAPA